MATRTNYVDSRQYLCRYVELVSFRECLLSVSETDEVTGVVSNEPPIVSSTHQTPDYSVVSVSEMYSVPIKINRDVPEKGTIRWN